MRDISNKTDGSDTLSGDEYDSSQTELENAVTAASLALDSAAGPDTSLFKLAQSILRHALAGQSYQDSGAANSHVLTAIQANFQQPAAYYDGMKVTFKAGNTNTGACQINVNGIGLVNFRRAGGAAHTAGLVGAGNIITAQYFSGTNRFEEVANTTPAIAGAEAPDGFAIYTDSGSATNVELTIVTGFIQPSAFTDGMMILFRSNASNNGTNNHQVVITDLGTRDIVEGDGTDPIADRFNAGDWVLAVFREVRNKFEIAFVSERPKQDTVIAAVNDSSSGFLYNLTSQVESRRPTEYVDGMIVVFRAPVTNTASIDINLDGISNKDLRKQDGTNFEAGEMPEGTIVIAHFVASEDRFRSGQVLLEPINPFDSQRGAKLTSPDQTNIGSVTTNVTFSSAPASDPLGFYSDSKDTFEGVSGVAAVDISANINGNFSVGDGDTAIRAAIEVDGEIVSSQTVRLSQGTEHISMCALEVELSAGDTIQIVLTKEGSATYLVTPGTSLVVRACRFG